LQERGYTVVKEQATDVIKEGVYLPWLDLDKFQKEVLRRQIEIEKEYAHIEEIVFLDRGAFDGEAYYLNSGLAIPEEFNEIDNNKYEMAFLIEELPFFDQNSIRHENLEFTRKITPIIENCYTKRNIPVIRVPARAAELRVDLVLSSINDFVRQPTITVSYAHGVNSNLVFVS
jgi:predicted ATPase